MQSSWWFARLKADQWLAPHRRWPPRPSSDFGKVEAADRPSSTTTSSPTTHPLTSAIAAESPQLSFGFCFTRSLHNVPVSGPARPAEGEPPRLEQHILRIQHLLPEQVAATRIRLGSWYAGARKHRWKWLGICADCWIEEKDLVIIGGGVAGYVAAIKAGQAGLKVRRTAGRGGGSSSSSSSSSSSNRH